ILFPDGFFYYSGNHYYDLITHMMPPFVIDAFEIVNI
ncbi:hypothetical protein ECP03047778_0802, partial [Escherichia coli P0304777.8]